MIFTISIGNKLDNRLQNLKYLTPSEHTILHSIGKKYWLGRKHSEQSKEKIRAASIGRKHSEQSKAKLRFVNKGKKFSDEHKSKLSAVNKGKKLSEEHKEKIRDTIKKKQVYCVQLDKVFASINIAARELYLNPGHISQCCHGKQKTTSGYHFQFV